MTLAAAYPGVPPVPGISFRGALQLYKSCGFEVVRRFTTYRKPLA